MDGYIEDVQDKQVGVGVLLYAVTHCHSYAATAVVRACVRDRLGES